MGSQISSQVQNEVKEGQKAVSHLKDDMISQQVELVRRMAERQMAMQVASVRELMVWFVPFAVSSYVFLYKGYRKLNSWPVMFPLIPITFGFGYQLHYAYGSKTNKIKVLAEQIMANEAHMMAVPEWSTAVNTLMQSDRPNSESTTGLPTPISPTQREDSVSISHQVTFVSDSVCDINESKSLSHSVSDVIESKNLLPSSQSYLPPLSIQKLSLSDNATVKDPSPVSIDTSSTS